MNEIEMTPEDRATFQRLMGQDNAARLRVAAAMSLRLDSFSAWEDKALKDSHDWQLERQAMAAKEFNSFFAYQKIKYGEPF